MTYDPAKWYKDKISEDLIQLHSRLETIYSGQTKFQAMDIVLTRRFGKCLFLDHKIQSSELDEFIYHEALVHPALISHPNPENVFIVGGGEGATLREILRHKSVKKCVMVDIDEDVIELSKIYLPEHHQGAFDDKRSEVWHTDARQYLADYNGKFDVIIIDLSEPVEEGPAYLLYTKEFYDIVNEKLTDDGIIAVQAGSATFHDLLNFSAVYQTLKTSFNEVHAFHIDIPSFGQPWGFCYASKTLAPVSNEEEIDRLIRDRIEGELKLYDGITHTSMFAMPKHLRNVLENQTRTITDDRPLFTPSV